MELLLKEQSFLALRKKTLECLKSFCYNFYTLIKQHKLPYSTKK